MLKRYTGKYIVRWVDKQNESQRKVYDNYTTALKAKKWLIDNKVYNVDIAVETITNTSSMFPVKKTKDHE